MADLVFPFYRDVVVAADEASDDGCESGALPTRCLFVLGRGKIMHTPRCQTKPTAYIVDIQM